MMNFVHGLKRNNSLIIKRKNKKYLNSAIYQKDFKKVLISFDDRSNIISQRQNKINSNNLNEESKANFNNNSNGLIRLEKEKNNLRKNLILPLKFNNPNKKLNTDRGKISDQFEYDIKHKNKCIFLTYKENNKINKKRKEFKPININRFINEINSFLLPNEKTFENLKNLINYRIIYKESIKTPDLEKLLKRCESQDKQITYELFYRYIIKKTFKELLKLGNLNNSLIDKNQIKKEYQKQINEIKEYLKSQNKEYKNNSYSKNIDSSDITYKTSLPTNLKESNRSLHKIYKIINIEKHKPNVIINPNSSSDFTYHIHNFDAASDELENQNVSYKNQELNKKKFETLLSLKETSKFIDRNKQLMKVYNKMLLSIKKDHHNSSMENKKEQQYINSKFEINSNNDNLKKKFEHSKEANSNIRLKRIKKNILNNNDSQKNNNTNSKEDFQFKTQAYEKNKLKFNGFNYCLDIHNKNSNNNDDIINCLNSSEKMVKFSNEILNEHINNTPYKDKRYNRNLNLESNNPTIKETFEFNNISQTNLDKSETFNNSLILENEFKNKDLDLKPPSKFKSSLLKYSSSQQNIFDDKFTINEKFFQENDRLKLRLNSKNYSQLFNNEIDNSINKEKIKQKNFNRFLKRRFFLKKKKTIKERSFKDFLKDDISEENKDIIQEEKNGNGNSIKKSTKNLKHFDDDEKDLIEKEWECKFKNFKNYIQKLKHMSKDEFKDDTLKFIKYYYD